jgi:hypothetical protein
MLSFFFSFLASWPSSRFSSMELCMASRSCFFFFLLRRIPCFGLQTLVEG